jgi:transposase
MMDERLVMQESLFYEFLLEDHVPCDHLLRRIDRFVDCSGLRQRLARYYSTTGRPSVDPELMIRMLLIGYCLGISSERRLCEEVHLNLAYRWFCRLGLEGKVPDHSTFSKNRHGRFRESNLFRHRAHHVNSGVRASRIVGRHDQARQLQTPPLLTRDHRSRGMALFQISIEPAIGRGDAARARHSRLL